MNNIIKLLKLLDMVEKYTISISDPLGKDIDHYRYSMEIMQRIIAKIVALIPNTNGVFVVDSALQYIQEQYKAISI